MLSNGIFFTEIFNAEWMKKSACRRLFFRRPGLRRSTESGERISDCVDGKTLADRLAHELLEKVKDRSAYEVQEFCGKYMQEEFEPTPGQFTKFGDCAYENGVKVEQVKEVIVIELRDILLALKETRSGK